MSLHGQAFFFMLVNLAIFLPDYPVLRKQVCFFSFDKNFAILMAFPYTLIAAVCYARTIMGDLCRVQKNFQHSSGCQIFIIALSLLRQSKAAKVLKLCIVCLENLNGRRTMRFTADVTLAENLAEAVC